MTKGEEGKGVALLLLAIEVGMALPAPRLSMGTMDHQGGITGVEPLKGKARICFT